jgi:type II secretory pathway pseudopilin PulG
VIAIIGILAALIMSSLAGAKLKGRQAKCLGNLKQLGLAASVYLTDTGKPVGRRNPVYPDGEWAGVLRTYYQVDDLRICPAAPVRPPNPKPADLNGQGTADKAWIRWTTDAKTMFYGSYGYNGWMYDTPGKAETENYINQEASIQTASTTPVFVDANWIDLWPAETDHPSADLYAGRPYGRWGESMARCTIVRHGSLVPSSAPRNAGIDQPLPGAVQMSLFDGHTEFVPLEKLWNYTWHRDWKTPAVRPFPVPMP